MRQAARHKVETAFSANAVVPQVEAMYVGIGLHGQNLQALDRGSKR